MTIDLDKTITLPRAEDYPNAERPASVLPIIYGDWLGNGRAGMVPCHQIDTVTGVYTPASHPVTIEKVFLGEKLADESSYSINSSTNFLSAGRLISIVRFYEPQEDAVSVTCTGLKDGADVLIDNPYEARLHFLRTYGGVEDSDIDVGSFSEAASIAISKNYTFRAYIDRDADIKTTLARWDQDVLGSYRVRSDGRLRVFVLTSDAPDVFGSEAVLDVARHCIDGVDGIEYTQHRANIANALTLRFEKSAVSNEYLRDIRTSDASSVNLYGEARRELDLDTVGEAIHATTLASEMFALFDGVERDAWVAKMRLKSWEWPNLEPFDYVLVTDPLGPKIGGLNLTSVQFQVLNVTVARDVIELDMVVLRGRNPS